MSEYKAGLHKNVSAIFNGVSFPKNDITQQPSPAPAPGHQDYSAPKPPASESSAQKLPVPSHMTPTKPKPEQPTLQSPSKETPAEQSKANAAMKAVIKFAERIPWRQTLERIKSKLFATKTEAVTTRQKMMVVLALVFFVVLIFLFIRAFSTPSQKITGSETSESVETVAAGHSKKVEWKLPSPYPTTLRDPMRFGSTTSQTGTGGLVVKGIVYSEDNPSAVIGDQIVHQGDKVLDVTITKINENSVEFETNGKKWIQNVQR
jgi:hypothetical protein